MIEINKEIKELLFLGPEGTYCEAAKNQFVASMPFSNEKQIPFYSVKSMIDYIDKNEFAAAVLPVEKLRQKLSFR